MPSRDAARARGFLKGSGKDNRTMFRTVCMRCSCSATFVADGRDVSCQRLEIDSAPADAVPLKPAVQR